MNVIDMNLATLDEIYGAVRTEKKEDSMKVEVLYIGDPLDTDVYEGEYVSWQHGNEILHIYSGKDEPQLVAEYPEQRIVRVRVIE